jgi:mono/diheme cytochrome c family protein
VVLALSFSAAASPADHPGKAVYEATCKSCHGAEGQGSPSADKFYQLRIPRLNSYYVQKKPDAELKEIITKGRRKMEPVRQGQPVAQHRLEESSVDDVIAYVRTLKKRK